MTIATYGAAQTLEDVAFEVSARMKRLGYPHAYCQIEYSSRPESIYGHHPIWQIWMVPEPGLGKVTKLIRDPSLDQVLAKAVIWIAEELLPPWTHEAVGRTLGLIA